MCIKAESNFRLAPPRMRPPLPKWFSGPPASQRRRFCRPSSFYSSTLSLSFGGSIQSYFPEYFFGVTKKNPLRPLRKKYWFWFSL
jgi:hypothetical protein